MLPVWATSELAPDLCSCRCRQLRRPPSIVVDINSTYAPGAPIRARRTDYNTLYCVQSLAVDLLNPSAATTEQTHKLKRLVQSPNSFFMDVKCPGKHTPSLIHPILRTNHPLAVQDASTSPPSSRTPRPSSSAARARPSSASPPAERPASLRVSSMSCIVLIERVLTVSCVYSGCSFRRKN